jgi:hypothetical protein
MEEGDPVKQCRPLPAVVVVKHNGQSTTMFVTLPSRNEPRGKPHIIRCRQVKGLVGDTQSAVGGDAPWHLRSLQGLLDCS